VARIPSSREGAALVGEKLAPAKYRAETAAAIRHLPADTRVVITAQVDELRAQSMTSDMLDAVAKEHAARRHVRRAAAVRARGRCRFGVVLFGAPTLDSSERGTLVVRGRWRKSDVEACFATRSSRTSPPTARSCIASAMRAGSISSTSTPRMQRSVPISKAEAVHVLVTKGAGPVAHHARAARELPVDRTIAFVIEGKAKASWGGTLPLPPNSDVYG